ncbi:MAG: hypothetical protein K9N52_07705 [Verrucomicrobia bacterium]|nr:hypothetical protein [Verrucomicrobiota bacterium]
MDQVDPYGYYYYGPSPSGMEEESAKINLRQIYSPREFKSIENEIVRLLKEYKSGWDYGHVHFAPSAVYRDFVAGEAALQSRFGVRVHLFENRRGNQGETDNENDPQLSDFSGRGRYLGFVVLRPPEAHEKSKPKNQPFLSDIGFTYILEAELVRPNYMFRPSYHLILTSVSSPRFGVLPFRSAMYAAADAKDKQNRRSICMNLALSQALHLVMGRFGTRPVNHVEFEYFAWETSKGTKTRVQITRDGVHFLEALKLLREECNAGGFWGAFQNGSQPEADLDNDAAICIMESLANGLPVILMVDYRYLVNFPRKSGSGNPNLPQEPQNHALFILGMHFDWNEQTINVPSDRLVPDKFVAHDVMKGPFIEWTKEELFAAAKRVKFQDYKPGIFFIAIGPKALKLNLHHARQSAAARIFRDHMRYRYSKALKTYFKLYTIEIENNQNIKWRLKTLLANRDKILQHYPLSNPPVFNKDCYWAVEARPLQNENINLVGGMPPAFVYVYDATIEAMGNITKLMPTYVLRWTNTGNSDPKYAIVK